MIIILSSLLLIFLTLSSCKEDKINSPEDEKNSQEDGRDCPDFLHCEYFDAPLYEMYIEGLIEEDKFMPQSVRYCSTDDSEIEKRSKSKGIDNLKVRVYYWDNSIDFEEDVYLIKDVQSKKHVIIYLSDAISYGQTVRVVELNEKNEEIKILTEIKQQDIPEEKGNKPYSKAYYCKNQPFILNSEDEASNTDKPLN